MKAKLTNKDGTLELDGTAAEILQALDKLNTLGIAAQTAAAQPAVSMPCVPSAWGFPMPTDWTVSWLQDDIQEKTKAAPTL
jgi:hypothetical protein